MSSSTVASAHAAVGGYALTDGSPVDRSILLRVTALPVFDVAAFFAAFDAERRDRGLGWYEFADELW